MELQKGGSIDDEILHLVLVPRPRLLLPHHRRQQARKIASFQTLPRDRQELHVHKNMKYSGKTDSHTRALISRIPSFLPVHAPAAAAPARTLLFLFLSRRDHSGVFFMAILVCWPFRFHSVLRCTCLDNVLPSLGL
jgi:hypothetical protein